MSAASCPRFEFCQPCVSPVSAPCQPRVNPVSSPCQPRVSPVSAPCQPCVSPVSAPCQPRVIPVSAPCLPHVIPVSARVALLILDDDYILSDAGRVSPASCPRLEFLVEAVLRPNFCKLQVSPTTTAFYQMMPRVCRVSAACLPRVCRVSATCLPRIARDLCFC